MEDVRDLDAVVVAVGGGGLISGVGAAVKLMHPICKVYGVEPSGADAVSRGFATGGPVSLERMDTVAGSVAPPMSLPFSLGLITRYVDEIVTVSDDDICAALVIMQEHARLAAGTLARDRPRGSVRASKVR